MTFCFANPLHEIILQASGRIKSDGTGQNIGSHPKTIGSFLIDAFYPRVSKIALRRMLAKCLARSFDRPDLQERFSFQREQL